MIITWYGQACFLVEAQEGTLALDPYCKDEMIRLPDLSLTADRVLCSHEHHDHNNRAAVTLTGAKDAFQIRSIDTYHDLQQGALRGKNLIHVIFTEGMKLVHMGDYESGLTEETMEIIRHPDILMINVGGFEASQAEFAQQLCQSLEPRIVLPMHYRTENIGFYKMGTVEEFLQYREQIVYYPTNSLEVTAQTPSQTAVLQFIG